MKKKTFLVFYLTVFLLLIGSSCDDEEEIFNFSGSTIDHHCVDITQVPQA